MYHKTEHHAFKPDRKCKMETKLKNKTLIQARKSGKIRKFHHFTTKHIHVALLKQKTMRRNKEYNKEEKDESIVKEETEQMVETNVMRPMFLMRTEEKPIF